MNQFCSTIKYLRERKGLTQQELADDLKLAKSTISMYETGKREPEFETLEVIADYFNVDMNFLLGKEEKPATTSDDEFSALDLDILRRLKELKTDQIEIVRAFLQALKANSKD